MANKPWGTSEQRMTSYKMHRWHQTHENFLDESGARPKQVAEFATFLCSAVNAICFLMMMVIIILREQNLVHNPESERSYTITTDMLMRMCLSHDEACYHQVILEPGVVGGRVGRGPSINRVLWAVSSEGVACIHNL